ncbi:MAG: Rrf2 family transcriptional regulator [Candidatus Omnitrophica bacterium]|nr:Rrf2 family transcriptional regulator [Candidatus Omnitrophota bacterium]MBU1869316.1 Rrf2 family transcriptional regulator [Candidatus Omnitrophota bacterium]
MKLITRDTDYAVRALCFIAKKRGEIVAASQLVKELKIPRPFLRKILQVLNRKGVLNSYKGIGGGFLLAIPAERIYLLDLVKIFQGQFKLNDCLFKKKICPNINTCNLRKKIMNIQNYALKELRPVSIACLIGRRK